MNLPNPLRLSALVLAVSLLVGLPFHPPPVQAAPNYPFFNDDYRGDPTVTLATLNGKPITERDLYLFLLLAHLPNPTLAKDWDAPKWAVVRTERRNEIVRALKYMAIVMIFGEKEPVHVSPLIEYLSVRWTQYPAYLLVWTDEIVGPEVKIYPEDVAYYIRQHSQQFYLRMRLQFYWAWFPSPAQDPSEKRRAVREKAEAIRKKLIDSGASLSTVAADYPPTTTLVPDNHLFTVPVGSSALDPLVEAAVRDGQVRQISPIVETRDGYNLVELRAKLPPLARPEEEIQQEARKRLYFEFLPKQFDHLYEQIRRAVHPVDRTSLWPFLADDTVLLDIGRTDVKKEDFRALFPDVTGKGNKVNIQTLRSRAAEFTQGEVVAQDVESHFLQGDPILKRTRPMAEAIVGVGSWFRRYMAAIKAPSKEEIQTLWSEKKDTIYPPVERHYYRLAAGLAPSAASLSDAEQEKRMEELKKALGQFREDAMEVMKAYRVSTPGSGAAIDPAPVLTRWQRQFSRAYSTTEKDLGFRVYQPPGAFPNPEQELPLIGTGEVSQPRFEHPGVLAVYFVVQERNRPRPSPGEIGQLVTQYIKQVRVTDELDQAFRTAEEKGEFQWAPALKP